METLISMSQWGIGGIGIISGLAILLGIIGSVRGFINLGGLERRRLIKWGGCGVLSVILLYVLSFIGYAYIEIIKVGQQPGVVLPPEVVVVEVTQTPDSKSTAEPVVTPTPLFGYDISQPSGDLDVAQFVTIYYENINTAQSLNDFNWGWEHLSYNLQSVSNHDVEQYASEWVQYRVKYEVWKCSETSVDVLLRYFGKGDTNYRDEYTSLWIGYDLSIVGQNEWQFESGSTAIDDHRGFCKLEASN